MRAFAVGQRREMAGRAVALRGVSIALACRTFVVSETCYRYSAKLNEENEQSEDPKFVTRGVACLEDCVASTNVAVPCPGTEDPCAGQ